MAEDFEHAVQRTIQLAGHVAEHEHHRQQILVINGVFPLAPFDVDHLRQRHQLAALTAGFQRQHRAAAGLIGDRQRSRSGIGYLALSECR
jgi:hypothetical protein